MRCVLIVSFLLSLAAGVVGGSLENVTYDWHKVVRIKTGRQLATIQAKLSTLTFEKWNHDIDRHMDIVLPPDQLSAFEGLGLDFHTMHHDLGRSIRTESTSGSPWKRQLDSSWFESYHPYTDHLMYLADLQKSFPRNSEIINSGKSWEGRDIKGIHVWGDGGQGKPAVLYHATVHAREWIAAPVVEYIATELISGYKRGDELLKGFLDKYDFYIIPVANPDGFIYSQKVDRMWRKNRQPGPNNSTCYGRDLNRNWAFGWNWNPKGASKDPCEETYRGEAPSDTPENQGLDALVHKLRDGAGIKLYVDWHSYGQLIASPYGYNETLYAPELGIWTKAASTMSAAIYDASPDRTTFTFGPSGATLYAQTGTSPDHVYAVGKAAFSYCIELRDTGDFGFILPPSQILNSAKEQWEGQKALITILDDVFFDGVGPAILGESELTRVPGAQ
ncbi:zinc carboxypeptidase [Pleomassaria siparia CBS 279.74]|uniref:Zinc carboxypeptidase n=1 Tax=Pleomassaria siparia CBS 279.74 TaxID=1314801 RepID=A0A6G1JVC7_9PLEO|nr:zinc carboxypeptidase [Pleomassaria siparia CBS 279.74]